MNTTPSAKTRIKTLLELGATWEDIGAYFGVHKATVWAYYKKGQVPRDKNIRRKLGLVDRRPGAIRLDYPEGVDAHQARARIIEKLTPLDRYYALEKAIDDRRTDK